MNHIYKIILAAAFVGIILIGLYGNKKLKKVIADIPEDPDYYSKVNESAKQKVHVYKAETQTPSKRSNKSDTFSEELISFSDPNLGEIKFIANEVVISDNEINRENYPQGYRYLGLLRVPIIDGMPVPDSGMFLVKIRGKMKVASGLFSVKLKNFEDDQDKEFFKDAVIHKKRPYIQNIVYKFNRFEDLIAAKIKARNLTEIISSDIEILDQPRGPQ